MPMSHPKVVLHHYTLRHITEMKMLLNYFLKRVQKSIIKQDTILVPFTLLQNGVEIIFVGFYLIMVPLLIVELEIY